MVKKNISRILISLLAFIAVACEMDHLYYATENKAIIRFIVDWTTSKLKPNGVSAYSFDMIADKRVDNVHISSKADSIDVSFFIGTYNVILHNDTEYEINNITFDDTDKFSTFRASIYATTESKYKTLQSKATNSSETRFTTETDTLAVAIVTEQHILESEIKYYDHKPGLGEYDISKKAQTEAKRITEIIDIEVYVENLSSVAGAPRTHLTNMTGGYIIASDQKTDDLVTHEFILNSRTMDPNNSKNGTIRKKLVCLGPVEDGNGFKYNHSLNMNFILNDNNEHYIEVPLNDIIETYHDGVQTVRRIRLKVKVPETENQGGSGGAFNPEIEDWENVFVDLPI